MLPSDTENAIYVVAGGLKHIGELGAAYAAPSGGGMDGAQWVGRRHAVGLKVADTKEVSEDG